MIQPIIAMAQPGGDPGSSLVTTLIMFGAIFFIFYFMIIRPQQKREKSRQAMLEAMKKGDKVVTTGGIHGTIAGIDDKSVLLQIADNVKVKVERSAISVILKESESPQK